VDEEDELMSVALAAGDEDIMLFSKLGKAIRFNFEQVRSMGRVSRGVRGIRLRPGDHLIGMEIVDPDRPDLLAVTEHGFGKRTPIDRYRAQGRGGQGVINIRTSTRNGNVITSFLVNDDLDIMIITETGKLIRLPVHQIRLTVSRSAQGVKLIDLNENDRVADVSLIPPEEDEPQPPEGEES
jgi:DNA gyrase subunit A